MTKPLSKEELDVIEQVTEGMSDEERATVDRELRRYVMQRNKRDFVRDCDKLREFIGALYDSNEAYEEDNEDGVDSTTVPKDVETDPYA